MALKVIKRLILSIDGASVKLASLVFRASVSRDSVSQPEELLVSKISSWRQSTCDDNSFRQ
jgi:hypothetical protein